MSYNYYELRLHEISDEISILKMAENTQDEIEQLELERKRILDDLKIMEY